MNKLLDMPDSSHLNKRDVQIQIKLLKVMYWLERPPICLGTTNNWIETSTTRRWFYSSLSKQLIHFLLNNGIMICSCLHIKQPEITEQGRVWPKLKMVTLNHIKHKPVWSNAHPLIQKLGKAYQPAKPIMRMLWTVTDQECQPPWPPFFLVSAELAEKLPPADFLPTYESQSYTSSEAS